MSIFLKLYLSIIFQKRLLIQFPPTTATWRTMVIQCQTFFAPFTKSSSGMNWQKLVRKWFLHLTLQTQEENHNRLFQGISISHTEYWPWKHVYWILFIIMFLQISEACSESRLRLKAEGNHYGIQSSGRWQGNEVTNLEDMQITINNIFLMTLVFVKSTLQVRVSYALYLSPTILKVYKALLGVAENLIEYIWFKMLTSRLTKSLESKNMQLAGWIWTQYL